LIDYKPVISKRAWIILIGIFVAVVAYVVLQAFKAGQSTVDPGVLSAVADSFSKANNSIFQKGFGLFSSIPTVAYLIVLASLSLWTLDSFLSRLKHHSPEVEG
jgi:drug/metabolite transporter (DMT)-like permease